MSYVERLAEEIAAGRPVAVVKVVSAPEDTGVFVGEALAVNAGGLVAGGVSNAGLLPALVEVGVNQLAQGRSGMQRVPTAAGDLRVYVESHLPDPVLVVVGAGHVGQMVAQLGTMAGFEVAVLDDRSQYANAQRFPTANQIICGPFAEGLESLQLGPRHHVVLMTRGHQQDRQCLRHLVGAPVAYLGMIGSRIRVETIMTGLQAEGVPAERLERVRAPIGLDIGARTPAEIAVAVIAEVIAARRGGTGAPLSQLGRDRVHTNRR